MADFTTYYNLDLLTANQAQPEVPLNSALGKIDAALQAGGAAAVWLQLSASDLATALAVAAGVAYLRAPHAFTLTQVRASLQTPSTSGAVTIDLKKNGATILSTELTIDTTASTSTISVAPAVISVPAVGDDDALSVDIIAAGTGAKGLIVTLLGHT